MSDGDWAEDVARMLLEAEDDDLADALEKGNVKALALSAGLPEAAAETVLQELRLPLSDAQFQAAFEAGMARAAFLTEPSESKARASKPRGRRRWARATRYSLVAAPVLAAATLALWIAPKPPPDLPAYLLDPLAVGESLTKSSPKRIEGTVTWRPGTTFHVRLRPQAEAPVPVSAQVFLRHDRGVIELPMTVEDRDDGLHVFGTVGQAPPLPRGRHHVVVAVVPEDHPVSPGRVATWPMGTTRERGQPLFWYRVQVKPPQAY